MPNFNVISNPGGGIGLSPEGRRFVVNPIKGNVIMNEYEIAHVAHEVNRAYCQARGIVPSESWEDVPQSLRNSVIAGVRHLMDNPKTGPEATHQAWREARIKDGWIFGWQWDPEKKTHPCLTEYENLAEEDQVKDHLFLAVVNSLRGYHYEQD